MEPDGGVKWTSDKGTVVPVRHGRAMVGYDGAELIVAVVFGVCRKGNIHIDGHTSRQLVLLVDAGADTA